MTIKDIKTKFLLTAFIVTGVFGGVLINKPSYSSKQSLDSSHKTFAKSISVVPNSGPIVGVPQTISIPSINVNAPIEKVGLDKLNRMDIPKIVSDTAWYMFGPKPGENGNAVIDGHFDTVTGAPSVFYDLKSLKTGDKITTIDANGKTFTFAVTKVASFPVNSFPSSRIFAPDNKPHLNLITCSGVWDKINKNYSERIVVFSDLVN